MKNHFSNWLYAIGRLRPDATVDGLAARLTPVLQQWLRNEDDLPAEMRPQVEPTIPHKYIKLAPAGGGVSTMRETYGASLRILLTVCGTVLLIACGNIANLLLARGTARRMQTAVRVALGATRSRLVRQSLTEAVLLALAGGLLGLAVAYFGARVMLAMAFRNAPVMPISAIPSWPVLGFAFLLSLLTGRALRRGASLVCVAFRPRRSAAWGQPQYPRSFSVTAKAAGHRTGRAFPGAAGLRRTAGRQPA